MDKTDCIREARRFSTKRAWVSEGYQSYDIAVRMGWLDECTAHMNPSRKRLVAGKLAKKWTYEYTRDFFLGFSSTSEVRKAPCGPMAYEVARTEGWLHVFARHFKRKPKGYVWTLEELKERAEPFESRGEFKDQDVFACEAARRMGVLDELFPVATRLSLDDLKASALKYQRRSDWQKHENAVYESARKRGLLDECCGHMEEVPDRIKKRVQKGTWTRDMCYESAKRFNNYAEWERGDGKAFYAAVSNGWRKDIGALLGWVSFKPAGYWEDPLNCLTEARKYQSKTEWGDNSKASYNAAHKNGYIEICTWHMENKVRQDEDSLYVWKVLSAKDEVVIPLPGFHLCKVGITSQHQNGTRIKYCAKANDMEYEVIAHCDVSWQENAPRGDAKAFESVLLSMGTDPELPYWYDGKTEFRIFSDDEMQVIFDLMGV